MNQVTLVGRTTKDIELKTTQTGKSVCSFTVAVNRRGKDAGTDFIPCVAWESTAQLLQRYVLKGDRVGITGRLQTRQYEADGKKRSVMEVIVEDVEFMTEKREKQEEHFDQVDPDEDLPF